MIEWIEGKICSKEPTKLVIENNGIAYEIHIPLSTYEALVNIEGKIKIFIHFHFSQEQLALFGFFTLEERTFFRDLLLVQGIGPQTALRIVSSTNFLEFKSAIVNNDVEAMSGIRGIGEKRANKLIFELKEKYEKEELLSGEPTKDIESGAIRALTGLGIPLKKAREVVYQVKKEIGVTPISGKHASLEEFIKEALKRL